MIFFDIDTQHDFLDSDGKLAVPDATTILPNLESLLTAASRHRLTTISSRCAHDAGDPEFQVFPPHCLKGTHGAERVFAALPHLPRREIAAAALPEPGLQLVPATHYVVQKKAYDLFTNAWLDSLRRGEAFSGRSCVVFGVATDYCVRAAVLGLALVGARVLLVADAIRGVAPESTERALGEARAAGVEFITTADILRRLERPL